MKQLDKWQNGRSRKQPSPPAVMSNNAIVLSTFSGEMILVPQGLDVPLITA